MQIEFEVYRGKQILGYHDSFKDAKFNAQMSSFMKPGIVSIVDKKTGEVIAKYEEGYEHDEPSAGTVRESD